jgi:dTDP-4-amino-4,6-dideoxygalactose transaminase
MKISALDLKEQITPIRRQLDEAIREVIDNANFILGQPVAKFEEDVIKYSGAKYAIGVSNGTDAISLSLLALGIKPGDGVICPTFTYYATAGAVAGIGAHPVFADIDIDTYNISVKSIEKILSRRNKFTIKAIIPVHLYGQCADMDNIVRLASQFNLKVIEDTAQAFGAEYLSAKNKDKKAGTLGDCGALSFFPAKNLGAFGDAGMILTNSEEIAEKIRILRNQGNRDKYYHLVLGRNNRMDAIQAAVLSVKLKYLDEWNKMRRQVAQYYNKNLAGIGIKTPFVSIYSTHIYHQYTLRTASGLNQDFIHYLQSKGIDSRIFYPVPLHLQECFKYLGYKVGDFPESEKAAKQVFTLPVYPELSESQKDYIINSLKEFISG